MFDRFAAQAGVVMRGEELLAIRRRARHRRRANRATRCALAALERIGVAGGRPPARARAARGAGSSAARPAASPSTTTMRTTRRRSRVVGRRAPQIRPARARTACLFQPHLYSRHRAIRRTGRGGRRRRCVPATGPELADGVDDELPHARSPRAADQDAGTPCDAGARGTATTGSAPRACRGGRRRRRARRLPGSRGADRGRDGEAHRRRARRAPARQPGRLDARDSRRRPLPGRPCSTRRPRAHRRGRKDVDRAAPLRSMRFDEVRGGVLRSRFTTLGTGGPARAFARPATLDELQDALAWAAARGLATEVVGLGSNLLVADEGVEALVLRLAGRSPRPRCVTAGSLVAGGGAAERRVIASGPRRRARWAGVRVCDSGHHRRRRLDERRRLRRRHRLGARACAVVDADGARWLDAGRPRRMITGARPTRRGQVVALVELRLAPGRGTRSERRSPDLQAGARRLSRRGSAPSGASSRTRARAHRGPDAGSVRPARPSQRRGPDLATARNGSRTPTAPPPPTRSP